MREFVCGPGLPSGGLSGLLPARGEPVHLVRRLATFALLIACSVLITAATGWWALLTVPAYLIGVIAMTLVTAGSSLPFAARLLVAVGVPAVSIGVPIALLKLLGLL